MAVPRAAPQPAVHIGSSTSNLPEPQGSPLEVSFRRLLDSCLKHLQTLDACAAASAANPTTTTARTDVSGGGCSEAAAAAAGADGGSSAASGPSGGASADDSDTAARVLKMRHYVDTLRELLSELRGQQDSLGLDAATLDLYDTHVKAVAAAVPKVQLPPYCQGLITGSAVAPGGGGGVGGGVGGSRPGPNLSYFTPPPPARPGVTPARTPAAGSGAGSEAVAGLSSAASQRLREAEAAQALLTDELSHLTAALKSNALGMAGAVAERGRLLDATDGALSDSLAATKRNVAEAGKQVKRSGGNLCFTIAVLLVVGLAFTAMVVYIKFTHLLGYRAAPGSSAGSGSASSGSAVLGGGGGGQGSGWPGGSGWGGGAGEGADGQPWQGGHGGEL